MAAGDAQSVARGLRAARAAQRCGSLPGWWRARSTGSRARRVSSRLRSADPEFIGKIRDITGLHLAPPDKALVLAVDGKSQIQALGRTAPCGPS